MKEISRYIIIEETYMYEDEASKRFHEEIMDKRGFFPARSHNYFMKNNDLTVTYHLRKRDDGVTRL